MSRCFPAENLSAMRYAPAASHDLRRPRKMSVGVDAHIDPAGCNRKIAQTIGDHAQRPVGADDPVRPWGTTNFAAMFRKKRRFVPHGSMWASTPTNGLRICIGASVFAGAYHRADRGVHPYGCARVRIGACGFAVLYRRADRGVRPYTNSENCRKIPPRLGRDF